ncbi:MAG: M48 family metalloprotease [Planctomycetota bacterium]
MLTGRHGHRRGILSLLLLFLASSIPGCCTDLVNGERYFCLGQPSDADEARIGLEYAPNFIAQSGGVYPDPELTQYLEGIVIDKMARRSQRPNLPWKFTILNTSQINAFALPGGQVFVTRGLLARVESEAQFAHLMGHEIGHVTHKHSLRGQTRQQLLGLVIGVTAAAEQAVTESETPLIASTLGTLGQLALLKFSREQELQSDQRGVDYALAAGYDPRESTKTFEMFLALKRNAGQTPGLVDALLATHPPDEQRVSEIGSYLDQHYPNLPPTGELAISGPNWANLEARVRRAQATYEHYDQAMALLQQARTEQKAALLDQAETLLRRCAQELPSHATIAAGQGVLALERDNVAAALTVLNRAVDLDPQHFEARFYRGIAYRAKGQLDAAFGDLEAAQRLFPASPIPCFLLAEVQSERHRNEEALTWYRATQERVEQESDLWKRAQERIDALSGSAVNAT